MMNRFITSYFSLMKATGAMPELEETAEEGRLEGSRGRRSRIVPRFQPRDDEKLIEGLLHISESFQSMFRKQAAPLPPSEKVSSSG